MEEGGAAISNPRPVPGKWAYSWSQAKGLRDFQSFSKEGSDTWEDPVTNYCGPWHDHMAHNHHNTV